MKKRLRVIKGSACGTLQAGDKVTVLGDGSAMVAGVPGWLTREDFEYALSTTGYIEEKAAVKNCGNCEWLSDEVCTNGDSPLVADYPDRRMKCDFWGHRKDDNGKNS